jgi:LuxR family transcriptional regulator, maltose regulon positive regulatory protein
VLEAKLIAPGPKPGWVERPELVYELERAAGARLTVLSAPVGSGKSTLLTQWVTAAAGRDVAWLTLDAGDNSPVVFWIYVVSALRTVRPGFGELVLRRLQAPGVVVEHDVLPLLADAARELDGVSLVLDDFHTVENDEVHEGLAYLVERLPSGARVLIATQVEPPSALERIRAQGELSELRDLSLSADQTAALLGSVLGVELERDDVRGVHDWTEGWAAGVQLAALSASGRPNAVAFLNDLPVNAQDVVDYVWDEVLARQRPEVRRFLAETSILDRFSAPLCAAITGRDDAEQLLSQLERSNAFLITADASRRWYRFHQVFRDVLSRELAARSPTEVADLHRRASDWYAAEGLPVEAIEHALVAGDVQYASDQLVRNWLSLYSEGRGYKIVDWLDRLPPDVLAADSGLCLLAASLYRSLGRRDEVERWLALVEDEGRPEAQIPGFAYTTAAAVAINRSMLELASGNADAALVEARRAEAAERAADGLGRVVAAFFVGVVLFFADDESAEAVLEGFLSDERTAGQHARAYAALAFLAYIALDRRDVREAFRLSEEAVERAHAHGLDEYPQTSLARGALGAALLADGDLDRAEEHLEQAVTLARRGLEGCDIALAQVHLARLRLRQDDREGTAHALASARAALDVAGLPLITRVEREVSAGLGPVPPDVAPSEALTDAELRVLRLLPHELTYAQIAGRLYLSTDTLRTYTRSLRRKLGVASRSEAVAAARQRGYL